jgi:hypothetical protein
VSLDDGSPARARTKEQTPSDGSHEEKVTMDDATIHERIEQLVDEEHELWRRQNEGAIDDETRRRLMELQVALDQLWDLLRQRKALRRAHLDPEAAEVRPAEIVENYRQ